MVFFIPSVCTDLFSTFTFCFVAFKKGNKSLVSRMLFFTVVSKELLGIVFNSESKFKASVTETYPNRKISTCQHYSGETGTHRCVKRGLVWCVCSDLSLCCKLPAVIRQNAGVLPGPFPKCLSRSILLSLEFLSWTRDVVALFFITL